MSPQWSPVVTTGTTRTPAGGQAGRCRAAMEPRRDDGDDPRATGRSPSRTCSAAMEPRRDDGDDPR